MIVVIRIRGQVGIGKGIKSGLQRLRLGKKYGCVLVKESEENLKLLKKLRSFIAYGKIDKDTLKELISKRGKWKGKEINVDSVVSGLLENKGKKLADFNLKPWFSLHPPRGGIDSKVHFGKGKGVLGDNKDKINELIRKML